MLHTSNVVVRGTFYLELQGLKQATPDRQLQGRTHIVSLSHMRLRAYLCYVSDVVHLYSGRLSMTISRAHHLSLHVGPSHVKPLSHTCLAEAIPQVQGFIARVTAKQTYVPEIALLGQPREPTYYWQGSDLAR